LTLNGTPLSAATVTDSDGRYLAENAVGYEQTVLVEKDGYLPFRREVVFANTTNRLDLTLEPQSRPVPGFGAVAIVGLAVLLIRRRGAKWR
jgi:hypothetical protein